MVHIVVNDLVIFLHNLIIDVLLVVQIRKDLSAKKRVVLRLQQSSPQTAAKKIQDIMGSYDDTNRMVVLNLALFVLCRLPELAFESHLVLFKYKSESATGMTYENMCIEYKICYLMKDLTRFLYMFSYCANFLLYYKFNKNVRLAFKDLFRNAFPRKS